MVKFFRITSLLLMVTFFLSACSPGNDELTDHWHDMATEGEGFTLTSSKNSRLLFTPDGMYATTDQQDFQEKAKKAFPFEEKKFYTNYQIIKEDDIITIKTDDGLEYPLVIAADRMFVDEKNDIEYRTEKYLLDTQNE